ncbi:acyl-CoA dehydrogenase family protein [uncultured Sneathiella sp.]|uniref:acyl-CoA dehydrogenase family protein n=1 Tax=uncultured Sneathiella sp. TaxID=879315 RepID=UPI0030EBC22F|tara:strand:- start:27354 stop:28520 length:1167 start_codon:yes stop_codon:yes gene_type:complete
MNFELSPAQREVYEIVGELGRSKFSARANEYDRNATTPIENLRDMGDQGLLKLTIAKDRGGMGSGALGEDPLLYLIAVEQTARYCLGTAQCLHIHCHGAHYVDNVCTDAQRDVICSDVVENGALLNATGSEPGRTRRGLYTLTTEAVRTDGGYVLNGMKNYATLAAEASYNVIFAGQPDKDPVGGHIGVAVPKGTEGLEVIEGSWDPMGMRAATSPNIELKDCFVPDDFVLGEPGVYPHNRWQAKFHLSFAAQYLGAAEGIFDFLTDYLPKRGTASDPYTQLRAGEIRIGIESTRWMIYRGAWLWTQGDEVAAELYSMQAKYRAIEGAVIAMDKAAQIAGSSAFLNSMPMPRYFRDLRIHTLHENLDKTAKTVGAHCLGEEFDTTARL